MRTKILAVAVLVAAMATLAAVATATATATQRVQIAEKGSSPDSFVLTPVTAGAIKLDKGTITACCWTTRHVVRAGKTLDVNDPHLTLTGANGTLKLRNRIEWVDLPDGWLVFTGTWKVVGGTGAYSGLQGHGRVVGSTKPSGYERVQFFGFLTSK